MPEWAVLETVSPSLRWNQRGMRARWDESSWNRTVFQDQRRSVVPVSLQAPRSETLEN